MNDNRIVAKARVGSFKVDVRRRGSVFDVVILNYVLPGRVLRHTEEGLVSYTKAMKAFHHTLTMIEARTGKKR